MTCYKYVSHFKLYNKVIFQAIKKKSMKTGDYFFASPSGRCEAKEQTEWQQWKQSRSECNI